MHGETAKPARFLGFRNQFLIQFQQFYIQIVLDFCCGCRVAFAWRACRQAMYRGSKLRSGSRDYCMSSSRPIPE
jgi:hypothetical protein